MLIAIWSTVSQENRTGQLFRPAGEQMCRRDVSSINMPILRGRSLITKQNLAMPGGRRFVRLARPADLPVDPGSMASVRRGGWRAGRRLPWR